MNEKGILKEEEASCVLDDMDRRMMQMLSDELSDIRVSKELFDRTLSAAKKQEKEKKKEKGGQRRRFAGGMLTAAAAVLVVMLGVEVLQNKKGMDKMSDSGAAEGNLSGSMGYEQNAGANWPFSNAPQEAGQEGYGGSLEEPLQSGGAANAGSDFAGEGADNPLQEPQRGGEWLCREILAKFDETEAEDNVPETDGAAGDDFWLGEIGGGEAENPLPGASGEGNPSQENPDGIKEGNLPQENDPDGIKEENPPQENDPDGIKEENSPQESADGMKGENPAQKENTGEVRTILWQQDGRELSCVIYGEDYRIVATLRENGGMRKIELRDWEYAPLLWEMAAERK